MANGRRILILDDDADLLKMYKLVFENSGFTVDDVQNSSNFMNLLQENHYDIILMDLLFPSGDNLQLIRNIRTFGSQNISVPIVVMTNLDSGDQTKKALEYGANGCLFKSALTPHNLASEVMKIINGK